MKPIEIDGSYGEGGGQILRTSLSLSCVFGIPVRIFNIRGNRTKPGLMPQHRMCIKALARITDAGVTGDEDRSVDITFRPRAVTPGTYAFDIGTAGSVTLLLQALLPPLLLANTPSSLTLVGGTHVPFSPSFDYLDRIFFPALRDLGLAVQGRIERLGFYPRGGGVIHVDVKPARQPRPARWENRTDPGSITIISTAANLPAHVADRQAAAAAADLAASGLRTVRTELRAAATYGRGSALFIGSTSSALFAGASALGAVGKPAEAVGREAAGEFLSFWRSGACLDRHIADQLVIYLAMANGASSFTTSSISSHLISNLWVISRFCGIESRVEGETGAPGTVELQGKGLLDAVQQDQ